ncbi:hypothetical protein [Nostoc favosum]|uniref:Uncharacterized protein n=1 Tax=Nostoc favosum CHAB5714 TaxID=2780399 RepID=A0ABS8IIT3_9NOSO|nr:hypothetical protein [Nostoc favosum]MCC5603799.1 hypothetical protein [Nostoc favosum CHAB5714]
MRKPVSCFSWNNLFFGSPLQTAIAGATNTHTGLHQAIHELHHGLVNKAKQLLARQIAEKSECADGVVGLVLQLQQGILRGGVFNCKNYLSYSIEYLKSQHRNVFDLG